MHVVGTHARSFIANMTDVDGLEGKVFGVSRYGSGSHIMAYVLAHQRYVHFSQWKRTKCKVYDGYYIIAAAATASRDVAFYVGMGPLYTPVLSTLML